MSHHPLDSRCIEEVGTVLKVSQETLGPVFENKREIKLGCFRIDLHMGQGPPRWQSRHGRFEHQRHLKQRILPHLPVRLQFFDQVLEGYILMSCGLNGYLSHPPQQFTEGGIARQVGTHDQGVDEDPH